MTDGTKQTDQTNNPTLVTALRVVGFGIPIFPCKPTKEPLTPHGFKDATTDVRQIRQWWHKWPRAMIGMPTGPASGIDVLDIDVKPEEGIVGHEYVPHWAKLSPFMVATPSGGMHLYFRSEGKLWNSTDQIAPGVDTRGEGGYVILPPSINAAGKYVFKKGNDACLQDRTTLPPFPADLLIKLKNRCVGWGGDSPEADPERVAAAMRVIPNPDLGWEDWKTLGMAIWRATGGSDKGFAIFDKWSSKSTAKYDADNTKMAWDTITRSPPTRIGAGTIFYRANAADPDWAAGGAPVLRSSTPVPSAREFVHREFEHDGVGLLVYYRGSFYQWTGSHYEECDDDFLRSRLYEFLNRAVTPTDHGYVPFNANPTKVNSILDALRADVYANAKHDPPFWLRGAAQTNTPADLIIACTNGLLRIDTRERLPHTPYLFNVNCLPFPYDPNAPIYPPLWMKFLRKLWPGDEDDKLARFTLQEIFGLLLTPDTSLQKIFLLVGPKRSGKGTIGRVLTALLGKDNVAGPPLASFSDRFGFSPLIDKRAAIISDARLGAKADTQAIAERLLSISGEDALTIDRKYRDLWTGRLSVRFLLLTNELPRITAASGALASRFILLQLTRSFYGKEDLKLTDKLLTELPGIPKWALHGLDRLRRYGSFQMPKSSADAIPRRPRQPDQCLPAGLV